MKPESNYGIVLLVMNTLPVAEEPADPASQEGQERIATELEEVLINHWDEMAVHDTAIPLLLVSTPGFEPVLKTALGSTIAQKFPTGLIKTIQIPYISQSGEMRAEQMLPFLNLRQEFTRWLGTHAIQMLMIKPFTNHGATIDRKIFMHFGSEQPPEKKGLFSSAPKGDFRPVTMEVVPFDGLDGPIVGLYKTANESRPALLPSAAWKSQNFQPQTNDMRATGTLYFNIMMTRFCLRNAPNDIRNDYAKFTSDILVQLASSDWTNQSAIFETALKDLAFYLKFRPLNCHQERGARGYRTNLF